MLFRSGLGHYLHDNPKYTSCIARKLNAYAKGMNSEDVTPSAIKAAYKAFADSGFRLRVLLKNMVEGPEFFNAPPPVPETPSTATKVAAQ